MVSEKLKLEIERWADVGLIATPSGPTKVDDVMAEMFKVVRTQLIPSEKELFDCKLCGDAHAPIVVSGRTMIPCPIAAYSPIPRIHA